MCFSASASFGAAGLLVLFFILMIKYMRSRNTIMFGLVPLLFAIQQTTEGIVWLTGNQPATPLHITAVYLFLGFAFVVWPVWLPLCLWYMEKSLKQKRLLFLCLVIGCIVSLFSLVHLFIYGAAAYIRDKHIYYDIRFPRSAEAFATLVYLTCTVAPFFITSLPNFWIYGLVVLLSYVISIIFWHSYFISVWCFFAALLSLLIYRHLRLRHN